MFFAEKLTLGQRYPVLFMQKPQMRQVDGRTFEIGVNGYLAELVAPPIQVEERHHGLPLEVLQDIYGSARQKPAEVS